ncbi:MAG: PEP/pyruvate-binding domain-containing protein [Solirubrobacteraceae bacterium]
MGEHVIDLAGCAAAPLERVGGKASGLCRFIERSLPVPPCLVVKTDAYRRFVEQTGLER